MKNRRDEDLDHTAFIEMKARLAAAEDRNDMLLMQADTDSLTGLLNARGLARRTTLTDWGWYVAIDLDGFKGAQDEPGRGHEWGNIILKEHADFLVGMCREREFRAGIVLIARTGGDEFTIWAETRSGARRMRDRVRDWASEHGLVTASAGMGESRETADGAMYLNKREGATAK